MYTTVIAALTSPDSVQQDVPSEALVFRTAPAQQVVVYLPHDDELALATLDRLRAVLENLESAVLLRQQRREQADYTGAGGAVEAYRG